ncbi:MAG: hypothetical protein HY460_00015 [Parcubacteria group bacterium]|nr:hypothetical protein [Parcubacteria group bacterium]
MAGLGKGYRAALGFGTILGWATFFSVLVFTNPQAGAVGILLFLISLSIGLVGFIALGGLWFRARFASPDNEQSFRGAFRHALLITALLILALLLRKYHLLTWGSAGVAAGALAFFEYRFQTR